MAVCGGISGRAERGTSGRQSLAAGSELKRADARIPAGLGGRLVFLRVPESAIVARVDSHRGVVAPAVVTGLGSAARHEGRFCLQGSGWVANLPAGISNRRIRCAARDAVAHPYAARLIHSDACHPAVVGVGRKSPLLIEGGRAVGISHLVPANARVSAGGYHCVVRDERLMVAELAIGQAVHEAVAEGIQILSRSGLGNAVSRVEAGCREWGHSRNGSRTNESRIVEVRKVHMELPEVQRA